MGFLHRLLAYERICIQCHNNPDPDTIASAYGVYCYLKDHGREAAMVYGGAEPIRKPNLKQMLQSCAIPLTHTHDPGDFDLLLMVDCQYGQGNAERFEAARVAIIDHHIRMVGEDPLFLIKSDYQSCSTVVWELLLEEGYPVKAQPFLPTALLYGLYTDTSSFGDLYNRVDSEMRADLYDHQPLFERLTKTNMTVAELMVASDAMQNHYFDVEHRFAIVEALSCDQSVLGIIGDLMIQVDVIWLNFTYTESGAGYRISLRSCHEALPANEIAQEICRGIGSGGGHAKKAGGYIQKEKLEGRKIFHVVEERLTRYMEAHVLPEEN